MTQEPKPPLDRAHNYGVTPLMVMIGLAIAVVLGVVIGLAKG